MECICVGAFSQCAARGRRNARGFDRTVGPHDVLCVLRGGQIVRAHVPKSCALVPTQVSDLCVKSSFVFFVNVIIIRVSVNTWPMHALLLFGEVSLFTASNTEILTIYLHLRCFF